MKCRRGKLSPLFFYINKKQSQYSKYWQNNYLSKTYIANYYYYYEELPLTTGHSLHATNKILIIQLKKNLRCY